MAHVVCGSLDELEAAGRPGAAAVLRDLETEKRDAEAALVVAGTAAAGAVDRVEERWRMVEAALRQALKDLSSAESVAMVERTRFFLAKNSVGQHQDDPTPDSDDR